jgi:cytochrome c biogenesis protein CcdA
MPELWATLLPVLLADVLNPVLFAFMVYAAGTKQPLANSSTILAGHTVAYFSAGLVLLFAAGRITERLANPQTVDFVIELPIGIALLWAALCSRSDTGKRPEDPGPELTPVKSFVLGAVVNFVGIPFALPYFAAIAQITRPDPPLSEALVPLVAYNLAYALPFAAIPMLRAVMGDDSQALLERLNGYIDRAAGFLMPLMLFAVGALLVADAVYYFATGNFLIDLS